jgi:hypothetical protein
MSVFGRRWDAVPEAMRSITTMWRGQAPVAMHCSERSAESSTGGTLHRGSITHNNGMGALL